MKRISLLDRLCREFPDRERERLRALIVCREVAVDGEILTDPKALVAAGAHVALHQSSSFVSRSGEKLAYALREWTFPVTGQVFIDAGASTGGFTDCLLRFGAERVYAVDVGWNQLDYTLRRNPRVVAMERTNIMQVGALDPIPFAGVADLSFRSLSGAASHIISLTSSGQLIALIKPQFETEHRLESFNGVVSRREDRHQILRDTVARLQDEGVCLSRMAASPVTGRGGNQEYLALLCSAESNQQELSSSEREKLISSLP
ncbi:MAG: TlyA family RNA methyltransferase [Spirochaetota bacterium]